MRRVTVLRGGYAQNRADPRLPKIGDTSRTAIEDEIERLLAILDGLDGDPDLEDDGSLEPSLGWSIGMGLGDRSDLEQCEVPA